MTTVRRVKRWLKPKLVALGLAPPEPTQPDGQRLAIVTEFDALVMTLDATEAIAPPEAPGLVSRAVQPVWPEQGGEVFNAAAGTPLEDWALNTQASLRYAVELVRVADVHHTPGYGAVIDPEGRVLQSSVAGAEYFTPTLGALPSVTAFKGEAFFAPTGVEPRRAAATVFVPWGALYNYGHFLLDALPGLALMADRGLLSRFPAISPPLNEWQRELLDLMLKPGEAVEEVGAPLIHIDDVVFTSCMNHFLHGPNTPLDSVRARILAAVPIGAERTSRRVYLTRRVQKKRRMVNERKLEAALIARGFTVIEPEALSITEQVDLFRSVDVVVAPTGAALANVLFMKPGAKLFELQPANYMGIWVRALAHFVGAHWHGFFCPSPLKEKPINVGGTHRPGLSFSWSLPLPDFLAFLDAHVPPPSEAPTRSRQGYDRTRKPSKFSRLRGQPSGMT